MHIQAHAMPGGVGETAAIPLWIAHIQEDGRDGKMDLLSRDASPNGPYARLLGSEDGIIELSHLPGASPGGGCGSYRHGSGETWSEGRYR